jgi:hypothetical protein
VIFIFCSAGVSCSPASRLGTVGAIRRRVAAHRAARGRLGVAGGGWGWLGATGGGYNDARGITRKYVGVGAPGG